MMNWIKFSFVLFVFSAPVCAEISDVKYGGQVSLSVSNRKGPRASKGFFAGYSWVETEAELKNGDILRGSIGWSYEQLTSRKFLMNQVSLSYKTGHHTFNICLLYTSPSPRDA